MSAIAAPHTGSGASASISWVTLLTWYPAFGAAWAWPSLSNFRASLRVVSVPVVTTFITDSPWWPFITLAAFPWIAAWARSLTVPSFMRATLERSRTRLSSAPAVPGKMADLLTVIALTIGTTPSYYKMLRYLRRRSAVIFSAKSSTPFTPLNSNFQPAHILALKVVFGIFGITLTLKLNEGKWALNKIISG